MHHNPTVDFCALIAGFAQAAMMDLGQLPDPETGACCRDLFMAEQNIAIIELLKVKTQGNLTAAECDLLESQLAELKTLFAAAIGRGNE